MRIAGMLLVILAFGMTVYTVSTYLQNQGREKVEDEENAKPDDRGAGLSGNSTSPNPDSRTPAGHIPVALNRSPNIRDGFRGEVHPLLFGPTRMDVKAEWTPIGKGRDHLDRSVNPLVYSWFTDLRPAELRRTFTARDFSAFLPSTIGEVGQIWALDPEKMASVLKQFHPHPSMHLIASGRRAGPDGAFAILRAVSPDFLDIAFRIHAEYFLTPGEGTPGTAPINAWYTPAYFTGRMLVNRTAGTVDYFRLGLPTEKALNVHLTVQAQRGFSREGHDIVRVERMELTGGIAPEKIQWLKEISPSEADRRLAKVFYKSLEIEFVPCQKALAMARSKGKPIFAIVSWGSFDDQSC